LVDSGITITTIFVEVLEIFIAGAPPIFIVSALFKFVPKIVITVPIEPELGVKDAIAGLCENSKVIDEPQLMKKKINLLKNIINNVIEFLLQLQMKLKTLSFC
jgi:hypothetical protein